MRASSLLSFVLIISAGCRTPTEQAAVQAIGGKQPSLQFLLTQSGGGQPEICIDAKRSTVPNGAKTLLGLAAKINSNRTFWRYLFPNAEARAFRVELSSIHLDSLSGVILAEELSIKYALRSKWASETIYPCRLDNGTKVLDQFSSAVVGSAGDAKEEQAPLAAFQVIGQMNPISDEPYIEFYNGSYQGKAFFCVITDTADRLVKDWASVAKRFRSSVQFVMKTSMNLDVADDDKSLSLDLSREDDADRTLAWKVTFSAEDGTTRRKREGVWRLRECLYYDRNPSQTNSYPEIKE